jgi:hypothetical protein
VRRRAERALAELGAAAPLGAVCLLAANDHQFKRLFHNALTGKLSDVAICFLLPLLVSAALGLVSNWSGRRRLALGAVVATLVFTLLEYSDTVGALFIRATAAVGFGGGVLTRDPTDMLALGCIPLAVVYGWRRVAAVEREPSVWRSVSGALVLAAGSLTLMASDPICVGDAKSGNCPFERGTDAGDDTSAICGGMTLFGLTAGGSCFDIVSVTPDANDGCGLGVANATPSGLVGTGLPFSYDPSTATVSIGSTGALGTGQVLCNSGMLTHDDSATLGSMSACTWQQTDSTILHMTATNEFDLTVTEVRSMFAGCSTEITPPEGRCTSTWTWHMKRGVEAWPTCQ